MPENLVNVLLVLIPALPLAAAVVTAVLGPRMLRKASHWPTVVAIGLSMAASLLLWMEVRTKSDAAAKQAAELPAADRRVGYEEPPVVLWTWAAVPDAYHPDPGSDPLAESWPGALLRNLKIEVALRADALTAVMLGAVTLISFLIAVYSIGYMHDDPGYWRFFAYISLFVFSMTMLVSVSNFALLYVFWEAVGLCSYLLIGFWYKKPSAAAAGKKAFLVNRVGDFGFALGIFLIWITYGTLNFHDTLIDGQVQSIGVLGQTRLAMEPTGFVGGGVALAICLLLMLGACGKSAQFPLHVWLPDAMEGPTPVSALIHAATMVTAGVYMVARCSPLYFASHEAQLVVAVIGAFTALLAALIAITQTDLKRILAYSTISQLGYMFLGLGAGTLIGVTAGMFHLFTHAFFKALLFLGAGSVMHAMGNVIDIRRFGGLRRRMPTTHWTFLAGCLALAGLFPLSGFWSKDAILAAVHEQHGGWYAALYWSAVGTALLTAFYTFRAYFITFHGEEKIPKEAGDHAHESGDVMTGPLMALALFSIGVGGFFVAFGGFDGFLAQSPSLAYLKRHAAENAAEGGSHLGVAIQSTIVVLLGVAAAAYLYLGAPGPLRAVTAAMKKTGAYGLSYGKFFFDQIYDVLIVRPIAGLARLCAWFDRYAIDGLVNGIGRVPPAVGTVLRPLQSGMLQFYALAMALGLLILIGALLICGM